MAYSELIITPITGTDNVCVDAYGGTRRQRGAAIAAWTRKNPGYKRVKRLTRYSETYGFKSATYTTYELSE